MNIVCTQIPWLVWPSSVPFVVGFVLRSCRIPSSNTIGRVGWFNPDILGSVCGLQLEASEVKQPHCVWIRWIVAR